MTADELITARIFGPPAPPVADTVDIFFDWVPNTENGCLTFLTRVTRRGQISAINFTIDLAKMSPDGLTQLRDILAQRHAGTDDGYAVTHALTWLLTASLAQRGMPPKEIDRAVQVLLLFDNRPL
jgi:hypothetical protein